MKKRKLFKLGIFIFMLFLCIFLYSCASFYTNQYKPNLEVAEDLPGLSIDPENCAYIGGSIRAIGIFDFTPGIGALQGYPTRTVRVPSGEKMVALVHYNYSTNYATYYGFKHISLPPLETGGVYVLFINPYVGLIMWNDGQAVLRKMNNDTGKYEDIPGATFVK